SEAIRTSAEEIFESAELEHEVVVQDVDACLARERWLHVYRIAQEAVSNIVKHAGAGEATLSLRRDGEHVVLRVSDDGRADSSALEEGLGIQGMRERAKQLGATLRIAAGLDGRGLGLALEVPVDGARADRG
ncbi:MAG: hypothetical protein K8H88_20810, partial [Sandaracinaceae bacterium]|nr:hypothetical protein [Sandaracinaceae bacterium]